MANVVFGENTIAGSGGWQPLDGSDNPITLTGIVTSSGMGSYTPSVDVSGRLVFDLAGAPDGGSVTVTDGSTQYIADIVQTIDRWSVATWVEAHAAINAVPTLTGGTVLFRPWSFDTSTGGGEEIKKNVIYTVPLSLVGEGDHLSQLSNGIILRNLGNAKLENLDIYDASGSKGAIINLTGDDRDIIINDCWIHGVYRDPLGDYSAGTYSNSDAAIKSVSNANGYTVSVSVTNCKIFDVSTATTFIMSEAEAVSLVCTDNEVYNIYADGLKFVPGASVYSVSSSYSIQRNVLYNFIGDPSDVGNPHIDVIQLVSRGSHDVDNVEIRQNVAFMSGLARGRKRSGYYVFPRQWAT